MNKNALSWVRALESGKYRQGIGYLAVDGKYCCLGIACVLYAKAKHVKQPSYLENRNLELLPMEVQEWLGLNTDDGGFEGKSGVSTDLAALNDGLGIIHRKTFKQIAKIIRSEPEGLFHYDY